jgi:hypothetical protein
MPNYNFKNTKSGKSETYFLWLSELEEFAKSNPHLEREVNGFSGVGDPHRMGMKKADPRFREHLRRMKDYYPSSTMETD